MRDKINITVRPFSAGTDKEMALKPLEKTAEVFAAWQAYDPHDKKKWCGDEIDCKDCCVRNSCSDYDSDENKCLLERLADEIADAIQAVCNLADRYGIDLQMAMERCNDRNRDERLT